MKYHWSLIHRGFFVGLLLTGGGIFLTFYIGWDEATFMYLGLGSFFLLCSVVLAFAYLLLARRGTSHLPEGWDELSLEEKHDFAERRAIEQNKRLTLWLLRWNDSRRHRVKGDTSEREE